jgi:hypothetical protein
VVADSLRLAPVAFQVLGLEVAESAEIVATRRVEGEAPDDLRGDAFGLVDARRCEEEVEEGGTRDDVSGIQVDGAAQAGLGLPESGRRAPGGPQVRVGGGEGNVRCERRAI